VRPPQWLAVAGAAWCRVARTIACSCQVQLPGCAAASDTSCLPQLLAQGRRPLRQPHHGSCPHPVPQPPTPARAPACPSRLRAHPDAAPPARWALGAALYPRFAIPDPNNHQRREQDCRCALGWVARMRLASTLHALRVCKRYEWL